MSTFEKAWDVVKLDAYEMAVAEKFSDPRDFMTDKRMRAILMGMPFEKVRSGANDAGGDLDYRYLDKPIQLEHMADDEIKAIYDQMVRLKLMDAPGREAMTVEDYF